ncbi:MAG: RHS repeat-associated core domain-containing protein, partial [Chlamydiae bacterium]|nr:RHS repeat-associated core domain-containing protein [Chlamydiota bacterium]
LLGRLSTVTKGSITTTYQYDLLDRIIEESTPWSKISYTYDEDGNRSSICKGENKEEFFYDPLKRLICQIDALGNSETIEYSDFQKIHINKNGVVTIETFDNHQNLISKKIPGVFHFRYSYDPAGNLIYEEEDVFKKGRLTHTLYSEYTYTSTNKIASITKQHKTTSYSYAPKQKIKIKPNGTVLEYTYDFLGNILSCGEDQFVYNKLGHLVEGTGFKRKIDPFGNILEEQFSNGLKIEKTYDDLDRPLTMKLPTGTVFYSYDLRLNEIVYKDYRHEYLYDASGNLIKNGFTTYKRDLKGQILELQAPYISQSCAYDPIGNLIYASPESFRYDKLSQLGDEFDSHYSENSALEEENLASINDVELFYDKQDRLIRADSTTFSYDALGRRLTKNDECFLYDDLEEVGTATYAKIEDILLDLHGTLALPILDATHRLRYLIDPFTKIELASYEFDPFGNPLAIYESIENPYRYALKHYDEETTLIYFGKRYYNPKTKRWITEDPIGPLDLINLYAFVKNNPFLYTDYAGLFSISNSANSQQLDYQYQIYQKIEKKYEPYLYQIPGKELKLGSIYFENGIQTKLSESMQYASMLSNLGNGVQVTGMYNKSRTFPLDVTKAICAKGYFPSTSTFTTFFQMKDFHHSQPANAKMLIFSHSAGAIQVRNALAFAPRSVRNRVISVAIAPAAIIPQNLCHDSTNYGTLKDPVVW